MLNNLPVPKVVMRAADGVQYFQIGDNLRVVRAYDETAAGTSGLAETLDRFTSQARLTDLREVVRFAGLPVEDVLRQEHIYPVAAYLIQAWWYEKVQLPMGPKVERRLQQALESKIDWKAWNKSLAIEKADLKKLERLIDQRPRRRRK